MRTKKCPGCETEKPASGFSKRRSASDGLASYCKPCQRGYNKRHYVRRKGYYLDKAKRHGDAAKAEIKATIEAAKNRPCMDCRRKFPSCAMDFDHVRGKKLFNLAQAQRRKPPIRRVLDEIAKCDLVCACCHRIRTYMKVPEAKMEIAQPSEG